MICLEGFNEIRSSITVKPLDRMQGRVKIIAVDEKDIRSTALIKQKSELNSEVRIYSDTVIDTITFPPVYGNQRRSRLNVKFRSDIKSSIGIKPNGKMSGIVDVLEPPKIHHSLEPIKDAFIRESIKTLNYGSEQTMLFGRSNSLNEVYRGFMGFDLSMIPKGQTLNKAVLKIYNTTARQKLRVGIYEAYSDWAEKSVTWINQPPIVRNIAISEFGDKEGYIEIDVLKAVDSWVNGLSPNNGFIIRSMNEAIDQVLQIYTKEYSNPDFRPKLEIEYYDPNIPSVAKRELPGNAYVLYRNDFRSSIEIPSYDEKRSLRSRIRVKSADTMFINGFISKTLIHSRVVVRRTNKEDFVSTITVRQIGLKEFDAKVFASKPAMVSRLLIPHEEMFPSRLTVRVSDDDDLKSRFKISRNHMYGSFLIPNRSDLTSKIHVAQHLDLTIPSQIKIIRETVYCNIIVRRSDETNLDGSIMVRRQGLRQIPSNIRGSKPTLISNIGVVFSSYFPGTINVRQRDEKDLTGKIYVLFRSDIPSSIRVIGASSLPGSILVVSGDLKSTIFVPYSGTSDLRGKATVRVLNISELVSTIRIGGDLDDGAYVFIM